MVAPAPQKAAAPAPKNGVLEVSKKPLSEVVANLPSQDSTTPTLASVTPKTTAIYKVDSSLAAVYTHVHTPLLLSLFAANFNSLVESPVATLAYTAPVLAFLQATYSGICLQPTTLSTGKKNKKKKKLAGPLAGPPGAAVRPETPVKRVAPTYDVTLITMSLARALAFSAAATLPVLILTILLGAPLTTHLPHTLLLSLHISLLAILPLFYARPLSSRHWTEICSGTAPLDEVFGATIGVMIGAWTGAVPIPLDWDRNWQAWPVTVVVGSYLGWACGREIGKVVNGRWRASWETEKDKAYEGKTVQWQR